MQIMISKESNFLHTIGYCDESFIVYHTNVNYKIYVKPIVCIVLRIYAQELVKVPTACKTVSPSCGPMVGILYLLLIFIIFFFREDYTEYCEVQRINRNTPRANK